MRPDLLLKKHFAWVAVALGGVAAWLQARGVASLLGEMLVPDAQTLARSGSVAAPAPDPTSHGGHRERSAAPILARNPFDSVTGPLDARPVSEVLPPPTRQEVAQVGDPLAAPSCEGVNALIVTESTDPVWSVAALQAGGEPHPKMRRVGDEVAGKTVAYIGSNPREQSPAVWLEGAGTVCQVLLFRKAQPLAPPPPPAAAGGAAASGAPPNPAAPNTALAREIASKIQKTGENEYNVDRSVIDKILENQAELMKQARIVPEQQDGKVVGIRLFGIRPDSLLGVLGMQNGDRLESINGFNMGSPEKALEAYARLRTASSLTVKVNRRGQPVTIEFRIK